MLLIIARNRSYIVQLSRAKNKFKRNSFVYLFGETDQNIIEIISSVLLATLDSNTSRMVSVRVAFASLGDCRGSVYERYRRRWTRPRALNLRIFRKTSRYATTMWVSAQVHQCTFAHFVQ